MRRAIWKGRLLIAERELPVKLYSAVEDRAVRFRLLDRKTHEPVHQRIVRKTDGKEVGKEARRKAFPVDDERAVILTPEELEALEPEPSRDIELCRFVPASAIGDAWFDRPYWLGPDGDERGYFALAEALQERAALGVARWVMRRKRYVGALGALEGYLTLVTLRRADQVISLPRIEAPEKADAKELKLAAQLVEAFAGEFEPQLWQDEYRERVCKLIEAKASGKAVHLRRAKPKPASADLADRLRESLTAAKERRVA